MSFEAAVHAKALQLDHLVLDMCAAAGSGVVAAATLARATFRALFAATPLCDGELEKSS